LSFVDQNFSPCLLVMTWSSYHILA
jgi:hypothetical protein